MANIPGGQWRSSSRIGGPATACHTDPIVGWRVFIAFPARQRLARTALNDAYGRMLRGRS